MGSQIAKCRFAPFCPAGVILADAAQNTLMFISFTAYFVELTSSVLTIYLRYNKCTRKGCVVSGVAR